VPKLKLKPKLRRKLSRRSPKQPLQASKRVKRLQESFMLMQKYKLRNKLPKLLRSLLTNLRAPKLK